MGPEGSKTKKLSVLAPVHLRMEFARACDIFEVDKALAHSFDSFGLIDLPFNSRIAFSLRRTLKKERL